MDVSSITVPAPPVDEATAKKIIGAAKDRFEDMRAERAPHEDAWRETAEYVAPRRTFELNFSTPSIRKRRLVDTTGRIACERLSALIFGYMMPPYKPWVRPTVQGRDPTLREAKWFEKRQHFMFDGLQSPRSNFTSAGHESLLDDVVFGNSVIWTGRNEAASPVVYRAMPLMECFWQENPDGHVDRLYRRFTMKLKTAIRAYPSPKLKDKAEKDNAGAEVIEFLHVCEPRAEGLAGSVASRKPFASVVICLTTEEVVKVSGYNTFPFAVTRFAKRAGENYGEGVGLDILPLARLLNEIEETILRAAELQTDPPLVSMIGRIPRLDRRPGGFTNITASQLRRMDNQDVIRRLYEGGDPSISIEMVRDIRQQINFLAFIDWMTIAAGANATATEWIERRDIRLRSMTPIVSRGEAEKLTSLAERTYDLTQDDFDPPPETLHGEEIAWEYFSPLAQAQQESVLESYRRTLALVEATAAFKPDIVDNFDLDDAVRDAAKAGGYPIKSINTPEQIAQTRAARAQAAEQERQAALAQAGAGAARDAGQALASVSNIKAAA